MTEKEKLKLEILNENLYRSYGSFLKCMRFFDTSCWEAVVDIQGGDWEMAGHTLDGVIQRSEKIHVQAKELQDNIRKMVELKDNVLDLDEPSK